MKTNAVQLKATTALNIVDFTGDGLISLSLSEQISTQLAKNMAQKHDEKMSEAFLRATGEVLTTENAHRINCGHYTHPHSGVTEEHYYIDGILRLIAYPVKVWSTMTNGQHEINALKSYKDVNEQAKDV